MDADVRRGASNRIGIGRDRDLGAPGRVSPPVSDRPRSISGPVINSTTQPTMATGTATGAKENIDTSTPAGAASPAISRLELVPIKVAEPASVVACAMGSNTERAGTPDCCCSSLAAGISMATRGVVLISADTNPTGGMSRPNACRGVATPASSRYITREMTPVCSTPLAMTSIAAMVMTPPLLNPANNSAGVAIPARPAATNAQISASTAGTAPVVMATRVATTMIAATISMPGIIALAMCAEHCSQGFHRRPNSRRGYRITGQVRGSCRLLGLVGPTMTTYATKIAASRWPSLPTRPATWAPTPAHRRLPTTARPAEDFTGDIAWVQMDVGDDSHDHLHLPEDRLRPSR